MRQTLRLTADNASADLPQELAYFLSMTLQAVLVARLTIRAGLDEGSAFLLALVMIPVSLLLQSLMTPKSDKTMAPTGIRLVAVAWLAGLTFLSPDLVVTLFGVLVVTVLFAFAESQTREPGLFARKRSWLRHAFIPLCLGGILLLGEWTGSFF